jgi:hypothetical protein
MGFELLPDGTLRIQGIHAVFRAQATGFHKVLELTEEVPVLSPRAEEVCLRVANETAAAVETALAAWSRELGSPRSG